MEVNTEWVAFVLCSEGGGYSGYLLGLGWDGDRLEGPNPAQPGHPPPSALLSPL